MKNLIIIGASNLQLPLIAKAKELGYATHVFAWKEGSVGFEYMTKFYPIDIKNIESIYNIAKTLNPVGVCSIASDLANITVQKLSKMLNLNHNSDYCIHVTTNKYLMRECLQSHGITCPKFKLVSLYDELDISNFNMPLIVKPVDRSGSRAITKIENISSLHHAIKNACNQSFEKRAIVEEFISGDEFSAECISQNGIHHLLNITKKFTTGAPHFIETGHLEPAGFTPAEVETIRSTLSNILNALDIKSGASHTEFKWDKINNCMHVIEVGSRMGGDFIGSDLVSHSTGYDFIKMVIDCAVGNTIFLKPTEEVSPYVCVKYCFNQNDINLLKSIPEHNIIRSEIPTKISNEKVVDSSSRLGYMVMKFHTKEEAMEVLKK